MLPLQMDQPSLNSIAPRFVVGNMEQALAFYSQLGFVATIQDGAFAVIERDGIALHLNASSEPQKGNSVCWIRVTHVEALHQQYMSKNVVQSSLDTKPWGMKEFSLRDPFRNLLLFAERIPEKKGA
jgi:hypothetical protein